MNRILLVSDVKGWGGWSRGKYIMKHLSDEFKFDLITAKECDDYPRKIFKYDLVYIFFHTMLINKTVKWLLTARNRPKIVAMISAYPVIRGALKKDPPKNSEQIFLNLAHRCDGMLCNNYLTMENLKEVGYKKKIYYAPRGVDTEIFYPNRSFKEKKRIVVSFSGKKDAHEKGLDRYIKPACRQAGVDLIVNERNFQNALNPDQMREFYNKSDVYIVASTMDGTPNTALEAASCGIPLLTNRIGNMPEFIRPSRNGFFTPLKIEQYVERLSWMNNNQEEIFKMGKRARKSIEEEWSWDIVLNKNERNIFREILS